ncbi:MAG: hypothetical protein ABEJ69_02830 [Candidatus Nanohaloarchaea archaeon]
MTDLIDYDKVHEDFLNLHEFIKEELGIETYREVMLLLQYAQENLKPKQALEQGAAELDYVG